ncbi:MAG: tRNA 2-selenouridine(34) synthase MnmH [Crocinitomicaceae bacterium]|nr:tRNA 2-selenouridine(34) synthase MnmH [Crocinitomicaceae bacterium]
MSIPSRTMSPEDFLFQVDKGSIVLDVRSPAEFLEGHIQGAISWPLFSNDERAQIGTLYKQRSREDAVDLGLDLIGPRMKEMAQYARHLFESQSSSDGSKVRHALLIHCWRGGMRSESVAWLLRTAGIPSVVLEGGYKAFRTYARTQFDRRINFAVLGGLTGSAKTETLHELSKLPDESVIDLEGLARHFGSAFGNLDAHVQPTTQQFSNDLYAALRALNAWNDFTPKRTRPIWIENESRSIGLVDLPEPIFSQIISSHCFEMMRTDDDRVHHLVKMYGEIDSELLTSAFKRIRLKLGAENASKAISSLQDGNLDIAARIALVYYDKTYAHGLKKRDVSLRTHVNCENLTPPECAQHLNACLTDFTS